jgi:AcrR family transcriptional regulator
MSLTRGRPRDPATDEAILGAARQLLAERGWSELTMADVAARAGVAKTTLYRRWHGKAELVVDATAAVFDRLTLDDHGSLAADVEAVVRQLAALLAQPDTHAALLALAAESGRDPALHERFRTTVIERQFCLVRRGRENATARGEAFPVSPTDDDMIFDMVVGTMVQRILIHRRPVDDAYITRFVAVLLAGFGATAGTA